MEGASFFAIQAALDCALLQYMQPGLSQDKAAISFCARPDKNFSQGITVALAFA